MSKITNRDINRLLSDDAIREAEQRMAALQARLDAQDSLARYTRRAVAAAVADGRIKAQFGEFISGSTEAEVDAQLDLAARKSAEISREIATQGAGVPQQPEVSDDDLRAMSLSDYAAQRHQLGVGNPNGFTRNINKRATATGVLGDLDGASPMDRARMVRELTEAGVYNQSGSLIS